MNAPNRNTPSDIRRRRIEADPLVYTVQEVADLLALSLGGTYALVREGTIPAVKMGGRWLVPKKRFHAWLEGIAGTEVA